MRPLRTGEGRRRDVWGWREGELHLHLQALASQQLHTRSTMKPPAPVTPGEGRGPDDEGVQQHAHLTRLLGGSALPLTLFTQGTGATTADAGCIHRAQASIGFSAPLVDTEGLPGRAAERAIWLGDKVTTREATLLPGQGHISWPIPRHRRRREGFLIWRGEVCRSKLGRAHWIGMQLMAQFQAEVPHPLADDLPALLPPGGLRAPTIWLLLSKNLCVNALSGN